MANKTLEYPKMLYVRVENHGNSDNGHYVLGETPSEVSDEVIEDGSVKIARYVLAGTGSIQHVAPRYVEDAKA